MSEHSPLTEFWEVTCPALPAPSRLYGLAPVGLGTPDAESLTSYLTRLAHAHRVSVQALVRQEIQPRLGEGPAPRPWPNRSTLFWKRDARLLNGLSAGTQTWVSALNQLTGRTDVVGSTLLRWRQVISPNLLLRDHRAWCPRCYAEQQQTGVVYDRLLWALTPVLWCAHHGQPLASSCSRCHQAQPVLSPYALVGTCVHCGWWLGDGAAAAPPQDADWQAQVSTAAASLVAAAAVEGHDPPAERIAAVITVVLGRGRGHGASAVGQRLQVSDVILHGWRHGRVPQLANLIRLSVGLGHDPAALLTNPELCQQRQLVRAQRCAAIPARVGRPAGQHRDWDAIAATLQAMVRDVDGIPCSVRAVGAQLGVSITLLRRRCPEECRQITEQYQAYARARGQQRRATVAHAIPQAVHQLHDAGIVPTEERITQVLDIPGVLREPEMRAIWRATRRALEEAGITDRGQERQTPSSQEEA
ncbi:MAG: TniQ family protein [Oscillochloris sp.]|nr:TniQ family protein [Oscillochloris sp.]